jgi:hypothetical protein
MTMVLWDVTPCSLVTGTSIWGQIVASTLQVETVDSFKTLVPIFQTTWHDIPEDHDLREIINS